MKKERQRCTIERQREIYNEFVSFGILQFEITKKTGRYWHEIKPNQEIKPIFPEKLGWRLTVRNEICSWTGRLDYEKLFYLLPNSLESFLNEMD